MKQFTKVDVQKLNAVNLAKLRLREEITYMNLDCILLVQKAAREDRDSFDTGGME